MAISLGKPRQVEYKQRMVSTGIYKEPVSGLVHATRMGLDGDIHVDLENHGGEDKAIYAYSVDNYRFWENQLGVSGFPYGQFGENFSVSGLSDDEVHIGDVYRIGATFCQVTQPRVPCFKLGIKMGNPGFVAIFARSGRVGFYLRVLEEGDVRIGDPINCVDRDSQGLNLREAMQARFPGPQQRSIIETALRIPALSSAWRDDLLHRLSVLGLTQACAGIGSIDSGGTC